MLMGPTPLEPAGSGVTVIWNEILHLPRTQHRLVTRDRRQQQQQVACRGMGIFARDEPAGDRLIPEGTCVEVVQRRFSPVPPGGQSAAGTSTELPSGIRGLSFEHQEDPRADPSVIGIAVRRLLLDRAIHPRICATSAPSGRMCGACSATMGRGAVGCLAAPEIENQQAVEDYGANSPGTGARPTAPLPTKRSRRRKPRSSRLFSLSGEKVVGPNRTLTVA
jgi:hypothetical protein